MTESFIHRHIIPLVHNKLNDRINSLVTVYTILILESDIVETRRGYSTNISTQWPHITGVRLDKIKTNPEKWVAGLGLSLV